MAARFKLLVFALCGGWLLASLALLEAKPILPATVFGEVVRPLRPDPADVDGPVSEPQFDAVPAPLPPNVPSVGFHITGTSEFGDRVHLSGAAHFIESVTVTMSSWAIQSDYPGQSRMGFTHPITLKIYDVDQRSGQPRVGRLLATATTPFLIPWRPAPDPTAPTSSLRPWRGADGNYYGGVAFNLTFDLSALSLALPDDVIVSVSFNTERHGTTPLGVDGPYNSLGVGLQQSSPVVGTQAMPGSVYWKTDAAKYYSDAGANGENALRSDIGWEGWTPAFRFNNSPFGTLADIATRLTEYASADREVAEALQQARKFITSAVDRTLWENNREPQIPWGNLVFDLLAETASELSLVANSRDRLARSAQQAIDSLVNVGQSIAERAIAEAFLAGGQRLHVSRAEQALDSAALAKASAEPAASLDELGNAWREAQLSLR